LKFGQAIIIIGFDGNNYAYYRWWSHSGRVVLANGNFNVTDWSSVFGEFANATTSTEAESPVMPRQGFAQALAQELVQI
jgi:hypothetical protein